MNYLDNVWIALAVGFGSGVMFGTVIVILIQVFAFGKEIDNGEQ